MPNENVKVRFKGWGVFAAAIIMSFFPTAILMNCFALYMNPICTAFSFSFESWSIINLIASLTSAVGAIMIAGFYQKKNMKLFMVITSVGVGICYTVAAFCTQIWQFYIVFACSNIFLAGLSQLPISMLVTAWFEDKRATMMSIAYAAGGVGGAFWSPIISKFIASGPMGWKTALLFSAAVVTVVMVLTAIFLVKRSPAEYGTEPFRIRKKENEEKPDEKEKAEKANEPSNAWVGVSKKTAAKSGAWIYALLVVIVAGLLASGVMTHVPNFITTVANDGGILAGTILGVYSLASIIGMVFGGVLMDKIGIKKSVLLAAFLSCAGLTCTYFYGVTGKVAIIYGFSFYALSNFLPKVLPAVLLSKLFGTKDYAGIYAFVNIFFLIGCALGSVVTAFLQKAIGYANTWLVYAAMAFILFIFVSLALKAGEKLVVKYPEGD